MLPFRTLPDLRPRVWGGTRLTPAGAAPVGEAWLAGPGSLVLGGPAGGATLDELAAAHGSRLTGTAANPARRFPLLVKVLDPADWLSVQVHPDDEQARRLEGPDAVGKTEAWYAIEAELGAQILLGVRRSVQPDAVRAAIRDGGLPGLLERRTVLPGDAYLVPAGTIHAVGPGTLVYEIQEPSDITYRCDDWGRPPSAGRPLHVEQSLACADVTPWSGHVRTSSGEAARGVLAGSRHFVLEYLRPGPGKSLTCDPDKATVHVLTAVAGSVAVRGTGWEERLDRFQTLVVPADAGEYVVAPAAHTGPGVSPATPLVLLARLPAPDERIMADEVAPHAEPA